MTMNSRLLRVMNRFPCVRGPRKPHRNRLGILALAVLALSTAAVEASSWSTVGGGCVPDDTDTRGAAPDWYVGGPGGLGDGRVWPSVAAGGVGNVTLRCSITNPMDAGLVNPTWANWEITYIDGDGPGGAESVVMSICVMPKMPGATACYQQFMSGAPGIPAGPDFAAGPIGGGLVPGVWDFVNNYYFLEVAINDAAGVATASFFGAELLD